MPETNFEKQVQAKMEEFRVRPPETLWPAVEARIREKKRRRFIFWWPILLLLGGGLAAGILLLNNTKAKYALQTETVNDNRLKPAQGTIPSPGDTAKPGIPRNVTEDTRRSGDKELGSAATNPNELLEPGKPGHSGAVAGNEKPGAPQSPIQENTSARQMISGAAGKKVKRNAVTSQAPQDKAISVIEVQSPDSVTTQPLMHPPAGTEPVVQPLMSNIPTAGKPVADSISLEAHKPVATNPVLTAADDSLTQPVQVKIGPKEKKKQIWQKSLTLSVGCSVVIDSTGFAFFKANYLADNMAAGGSGSGGPAPGPSYFVGPSNVSYSTSFSAGIQLAKPLSKKLELQLGAGYNYLSSRIRVGSKADPGSVFPNNLSAVNRIRLYYRYDSAGRLNNYHNQYHFISLSAGLSWHFIRRSNFSVSWVNNLDYRRLLFSSMLHYDRSIPGYYKDNTLLNRNQLFFTTGLAVSFRKGFVVKPYLSYGFTPVLKKGNGTTLHFGDAGVKFSFRLNNK